MFFQNFFDFTSIPQNRLIFHTNAFQHIRCLADRDHIIVRLFVQTFDLVLKPFVNGIPHIFRRCRVCRSGFFHAAVCFQRRAVVGPGVRLVVEVDLPQVLQLGLGQGLCRLGRGIVRFRPQQSLDVGQHLLQKRLDLLHHPVAPLLDLGVHPGFRRLLAHIIPEVLFRSKNAAHGVRRDLFHGLVVGQLLARPLVPVQIALHQLLHAVHAVLLHKVVLKGVDQLLPAGVVPAVQLVQRLVHHSGGVGFTRVKHLARRALDQALGVVCKALHHPLHCHAAGLGAQLDQGIVRPGALAHAAVRLVVGARVIPQRCLAGLLAQLGRFHFLVMLRFALALGVSKRQRRAPCVAQGQHLLHPSA